MNLDAVLLLIIDECSGSLQVGVVKHIGNWKNRENARLPLKSCATISGSTRSIVLRICSHGLHHLEPSSRSIRHIGAQLLCLKNLSALPTIKSEGPAVTGPQPCSTSRCRSRRGAWPPELQPAGHTSDLQRSSPLPGGRSTGVRKSVSGHRTDEMEELYSSVAPEEQRDGIAKW